MTTFVTVGNATQPFDRLLLAVAAVTARLIGPTIVQRGVSRVSHDTWQVVDFLDMDEFAEILSKSDILIMHGGAGSVLHAVKCGKCPVVMPRRACFGEHVDDHQVEFVLEMERAGYLQVALEPGDLDSAIGRAIAWRERRAIREEPPLIGAVHRRLNEWAMRKAGTVWSRNER